MGLMTIMMNCLTNIMDIGNKTIVLMCDPDDEKMFPFHYEEGSCMLPVGEKKLLTYWTDLVSSYPNRGIYIAAKNTPYIEHLCHEKQINYLSFNDDLYKRISEMNEDVCIISVDNFMHEEDYSKLLTENENVIVCSPWVNQEKSFAIGKTDNYIKEIYAHPRDHYATDKVFEICSINKEWVKKLCFIRKGSYTLNCGQMPDDKFHLESIVDQLIKMGMKCKPLRAKKKIIKVKHAWDIFQANEYYCMNLSITEDEIGKNSTLNNVVRDTNSHIHVGENCYLNNVTIEGNCWIGDNVTIENGAFIGKNCIIQNNCKISNSCMIHANTVIGEKNKIGFGAEVCGVTMEGVAMVHTCEVFGVIGKYVDIAAGVIMAILRFDDGEVTRKVNGCYYKSPYTNAICIGNYVRTGVNNTFYPGVSVGEKSALGPGLIIDQDIPANSLILVKQEKIVKEWGSNKYGW